MIITELNDNEIQTLRRFRAMNAPAGYWIEVTRPSTEFRQAIDILVLSGLAERRNDFRADPFGPQGWLDQWRLTQAGITASESEPQTTLFGS